MSRLVVSLKVYQVENIDAIKLTIKIFVQKIKTPEGKFLSRKNDFQIIYLQEITSFTIDSGEMVLIASS